MTESLRQKQKQVARTLILQATADEIVTSGLENLSLQAVAKRAGVSNRTLYNYFENRDTLLAELLRWSDELTLELGGSLIPRGLAELPEQVRAVWRTWDAQGTVFQAVTHVAAAQPDFPTGRPARHEALARAVADVRPDFSTAQCHEVAALLHALIGPGIHAQMRSKDGIAPDVARDLIVWTIATLRDALGRGEDPYTPSTEEQP